MKKFRRMVGLALVFTSTLALLFAAPMSEQQASVSSPAPVNEVQVQPTPRFVVHPTPERWGTELGVLNQTGYTFVSLDIYSERMSNLSPNQENLLTTPLESGDRVQINLLHHLLLFNELSRQDSKPFYYTAIDEDGDYFQGVWDPAHDLWTISLDFEDYRGDYLARRFPADGAVFGVLNRINSPIIEFSFAPADENLLGEAVLLPGQEAIIPAVLALGSVDEDKSTYRWDAYDESGQRYTGYYSPAESSKAITIFPMSQVYIQEGQYELIVDNQLDDAIWYLFAMTGQEYLYGDWGDDLLGYTIILEGQEEQVDLYGSPRLAQLLDSGWEGRLYLVAETYDEGSYLVYTEVSPDYPYMYVSVNASRLIDESIYQEEEEGVELVLYNNTQGQLWILHESTEPVQPSYGEDLLGDGIWEHDQFITLSVERPFVDSGQQLYLWAYDKDGQPYLRTWSGGEGRVLIYTEADQVL